MANSLLSRAPSALPPLSGPEFRKILESAREELHQLEDRVSPGHAGDLGVVLDVIEQVLIFSFGWQYPEPLSPHDREVLAALGCPA